MTQSKPFLVRFLPAVLILLCMVFGSDRALAQRPGTTEGYWSGTVKLAEGPLNIMVWLNRNPAGAWGGTLDLPTEGTTDLPLVVTGDGKSTAFRLPGSDLSPTFKGTLSADANKITGNYVKEGSSFPFELTRLPGPPRPAAPSPSTEKALTHARRVRELVRQEKFADVVKEFDAPLAAKLPVGTLSQAWSTLRTQSGLYKSELGQSVQLVGTLTVVTLGCQFERSALNMVVVFGPDEKISGLQFVPRPASAGVPLQPQPAPRTPNR